MLQWKPSKENISFINKPLGLSHVWSHFVESIKWRFFLSKLHDHETNFQKDDRGIFLFPVLQIEHEFPVHTMFSQFWRYHYENVYTRLKTGSVTANADAVGITFRCLATVSKMTWIILKCTIISVKVLNLYI